MQWNALLGHQLQYAWFSNALRQGRLATSFLFVGPDGIGKRTFARLLAKSLLCRSTPAKDLSACGLCEDCVQVEASTHPDLIELFKPAEKSSLPLDLLIGGSDNRMREGLCHEISLKPFGGRRKVAIIDDADYLFEEGANALLKTLEEPPVDSLLILISTSLQRQLPTIRSRCQSVLFHPLRETELIPLLIQHGLAEEPSAAEELARVSRGSMSTAKQMQDPELREFRALLLDNLSKPRIPLAELTKNCSEMIDAAGKEGKVKRDRTKVIIAFAAQFYRELTLQLDYGVSRQQGANLDQHLTKALEQATKFWRRGGAAALSCWNICLQSIENIDRNANQATLLEWWIAKLAEQSGF